MRSRRGNLILQAGVLLAASCATILLADRLAAIAPSELPALVKGIQLQVSNVGISLTQRIEDSTSNLTQHFDESVEKLTQEIKGSGTTIHRAITETGSGVRDGIRDLSSTLVESLENEFNQFSTRITHAVAAQCEVDGLSQSLRDLSVKVSEGNRESKGAHGRLSQGQENLVAKLRSHQERLVDDHGRLAAAHDVLKAQHTGLSADHAGLADDHDGLEARYQGLIVRLGELAAGLGRDNEALKALQNTVQSLASAQLVSEKSKEILAKLDRYCPGGIGGASIGAFDEAVFFDHAQCWLTDVAQAELSRASDWLDRYGGAARFYVVGYASKPGSPSNNEDLAEERARMVGNFLAQRSEAEVSLFSCGERALEVNNPDAPYNEARSDGFGTVLTTIQQALDTFNRSVRIVAVSSSPGRGEEEWIEWLDQTCTPVVLKSNEEPPCSVRPSD